MEELELLTAAEVADILRMNKQVILRKLASGEIEAYKLGKDWRIRKEAFLEWLESHSNRRTPPDERSQVLANFFDREGRLVSIPTRRKKRVWVLEHMLERFESERVYPESEVNEILREFHEDVCTLRREFIACKMMVRKDGRYRRCSSGDARSEG